MRIFHLTTPAEWATTQDTGEWTTSTRGRTLAEEGFVHCAEEQQVDDVRSRWFAGVDDLLVLEIETDRLTVPWRREQLTGADQPYPHVHGPVDLDAVVAVRPVGAGADRRPRP
jgi:uncharacterized protein (DUF952 family)